MDGVLSMFKFFKNYEAQAIKCKLYGLKSPNKDHFSDEENQTFKEHVSDKIFKPKFIKYNTEEDIFEVSLNDASCADPLLSSVHNFLTNKSLAEYKKFNDILLEIKSQEESEFYIEQLKLVKC